MTRAAPRALAGLLDSFACIGVLVTGVVLGWGVVGVVIALVLR